MGATTAADRVQEWIAAVERRGAGVSTEDLHSLFSPGMVSQWSNLADAAQFRATVSSSRFATCEIESIDAIDEHRVVVRLRRAGLELWCHVSVELEPPHRIAAVKDTLEDGVSLSAVNLGISRELHRRWSTRRVFDDSLALRIGGAFVADAVERSVANAPSARPVMPLARFRLAEDRLAAAIDRGVRQYLILGAGMDSWAYRNSELAAERGVTVSEVDAPVTQRFKRRRLAEAGIAEPEHVRFVAVDFETDNLTDRLTDAGFDTDAPVTVAWLGVIYYLTKPAIASTLSYIGSLATGSELILDYFRPPDTWDIGMRNGALIAATNGEPWQSTFTETALRDLLADHGLTVVDHLTALDALARFPTDDAALTANQATSSAVAIVDDRAPAAK